MTAARYQTDAEYRLGLSELEKGKLRDEDIRDLADAAYGRMEAAFDEPVLWQCADVLSIYTWREYDARVLEAHGDRIRRASLELADALADSGHSSLWQLLDPGIWDGVPPDYIGPNIRIEDYLRILAEYLDHREWAYGHLVTKRFSGNLGRVVVRHVRDVVMGHWDVLAIGRRRDAFDEDDKRAPHKLHPYIAEIASVILAMPITPGYVKDTLRQRTAAT